MIYQPETAESVINDSLDMLIHHGRGLDAVPRENQMAALTAKAFDIGLSLGMTGELPPKYAPRDEDDEVEHDERFDEGAA